MSDSEWVSDPTFKQDDSDWVSDPTFKGEKLKTNISHLESGARGLAQGASFGFADEITGAAESVFSDKTYERARDESRDAYGKAKEANPGTYFSGEIGGAGATAFIPGFGALNAAKGAGLVTKMGLGAIQGGLAGTGLSEGKTAEDIASDAVLGAATGAAVTYGVDKALVPALKWGAGKASHLKRLFKPSKQTVDVAQSQSGAALAHGSASSQAALSGGDLSVEQGGKLFNYKAPQSLDELRKWTPDPGNGQMAELQRLKEIEKIVPDLSTKPLKYHYDMLENPKAMKALKLQFENLPTGDAQKIAAYNQQMVSDSGRMIKKTVEDIAGGEPRSLTDAGYDFISATKDKYNSEKEMLGPLFEQLKTESAPISSTEAMDIAAGIAENTKFKSLLRQDEATGRLFLEKNTPRSGVSDFEHRVVGRVIDDLHEGMSFKEVQSVRDFLRKSIDPANPAATEEIGRVRSILLDILEGMASKRGPGVGETFKKYAINERSRESIEKIIGGKIESFDQMFAANPDKVVQKIFSNPNYAKVVSDYIGPEKINEMVGSYVENGIKKAFDSTIGFKPSVLKNWLKANQTFLSAHVDDSISQRLSALAEYGYYGRRFLDEVNPSGTAASLKEMIEPRGFFQKVKQQGFSGAVQSEAAQKIGAMMSQNQATKTLNESLGGMNPRVADYLTKKFKKLPDMQGPTSDAAIFQATDGMVSSAVPMLRAADQQPDNSSNFNKSHDKQALIQKTQGTKYQHVLANAAQKSDAAFAAAHFVLAGRDKAYRAMIEGK